MAAPLMVFCLFGCAPVRAPVLKPQMTAAASARADADATVTAVRPIRPFAAAEDDPQAAILAAMSVTDSAPPQAKAPSEIVVRTDAGATLSVVQPNAAGLRPGERVMLLGGASGRRLIPVSP